MTKENSMRIELIFNEKPVETSISDEKVSMSTMRHKKYESDTLDRDMIESPCGKDLDSFIIEDMQLTLKSDVDLVIEMLNKVKENLSI